MTNVRVAVVGSGPVGAAYARILWSTLPDAEILMIEAGPALTTTRGENVRNIGQEPERLRARIASQGPAPGQRLGLAVPSGTVATHVVAARQGTHLLASVSSVGCHDMPAAAMSTCVGGQGAHWTCAAPRPHQAERMGAVPDAEWDAALAESESLLHVRTDAFGLSAPGEAIRRALAEVFDPRLPAGSKVRALPVAADVLADGTVRWAGTDTVLGPLSRGKVPRFELMSETICRVLQLESGRVTGITVEDLRTGTRSSIATDLTVVAADAFRTPQLLWASGIRPEALGRYLTEHPGILGFVRLREGTVPVDEPVARRATADPVTAAVNVPFSPAHPFNGQVMFSRTLPIAAGMRDGQFATLSWWCRKFPRAEDRVEFCDDPDVFGMPSARIRYSLTELERREVTAGRHALESAAAALGEFVPSGEPRLLPAGSSLHYQGTYRIGPRDDGTSVCDSFSRVWGIEGLLLGGNGLIASATACNPTLTSVALAVRGALRYVGEVTGRSPSWSLSGTRWP
jgi:pyranose oxidase